MYTLNSSKLSTKINQQIYVEEIYLLVAQRFNLPFRVKTIYA